MLSTVATPRDLDLLAARAFPAAEEEHDHGWLLRATPGPAPRRVSSALPPWPAGAERVDAVEAWYAARGLVPRIMVSPDDEAQAGLDAELASRGWAREPGPGDVLVGDPDTVLDTLGGPPHHVVPSEHAELRSPDPVVPLATAGGAGRAVAVLQEGWSFVLALEVDPEHRRRGIASALVRAWARLAEGRKLYLQVERGNDPAHALYAAAGFSVSHGYHYRSLTRYS